MFALFFSPINNEQVDTWKSQHKFHGFFTCNIRTSKLTIEHELYALFFFYFVISNNEQVKTWNSQY